MATAALWGVYYKHVVCYILQAKQQLLVGEYEARLATAGEAERAIGKAMATQVESLKRQVATLEALQAENEALKTTQEVGAQDTPCP